MAVLGELKRLNPGLPNDILEWILDPLPKRYMKADIFVKLTKESFIYTNELDTKFKALLANHPKNINIYVAMIKITKALIVDDKIMEPKALSETLEHIFQYLNEYKQTYPQIAP